MEYEQKKKMEEQKNVRIIMPPGKFGLAPQLLKRATVASKREIINVAHVAHTGQTPKKN